MSAHPDYFPVQRIAQACLQCRRKKCRCTGDRPVCGHCRRSGLECIYFDGIPPQPAHRPGQTEESDTSPQNASSTVAGRLAALEDKLENVGSQVHRIESHLGTILDAIQSRDMARPTSTPTEPPGSCADPASVNANQDLNFVPEQEAFSLEDAGIPEDVLLAVIDAYFNCFHNQPYSFFHEGNFRRSLSEKTLPMHLLLATMAMAARFCPHPYFSGRTNEASVEYANRAWKLVISVCFTAGRAAEVSTVQTIALLSLFDFTAGRSRHGSAWVKVGIAVRIAQDCGLMLENATHLPYVEQEERRRVFWSVYLLDRLVSCGRGRPPAIVDASCHLQLPCEESIWKDGLWYKTQSLDEMTNRRLPRPERQGAFAQVIVMAHILGRSAQYMLQEFNIRSPHHPWDPTSDFAAIESDLLHFETYLEMQKSLQELLAPHITAEGGVDSHNTGPIIYSRALFHLCYCLLNHPFLLRRRLDTCRSPVPVSFIARSFDVGWQHAQQLIGLIRDTRNQGCLFHSSFGGYCAIIAGSIAALKSHDEDLGMRAQAQALLQEVISYLNDMGRYWNNVSTMALLLRQMVDNSFIYSNLSSPRPQIESLSPAEVDNMWLVVDYSTMSNGTMSEGAHDQQADASVWLDSWIGLFETFDGRSEMSLGI